MNYPTASSGVFTQKVTTASLCATVGILAFDLLGDRCLVFLFSDSATWTQFGEYSVPTLGAPSVQNFLLHNCFLTWGSVGRFL